MKIALIGNYPPKACGIGTFTNSVARALLANLNTDRIDSFAEVIAMEDADANHDYPAEVTRTITTDDPAAYRATADYLNAGGFDLVLLQHEYGIFGGDDGVFILQLLDRLRLPLVVTCHTVLREPSFGQRNVLRRIIERAQTTVVMSQMAAGLLREVFGAAEDAITVIEHGVPKIDTLPRAELRAKLGWADRTVLFTFGLLGRGKGIETAIRALPAIAAEHPDLLYVVLGKTHPHVLRDSGEEYREYLLGLAEELGVGDNLQMISEFATEQDLFARLRACDLYVIPYPNEAQITSGTLAYAVGSGAAVISTPFWHATELLDEGRGRLFPFHDHRALADTARELLGDPAALTELRRRATDYGRRLEWPTIGQQYLDAFGDATAAYHEAQLLRSAARTELPALDLQHLLRFTDDCGILQHGKYAIPNRYEGYCLDDNGRALLLVGMLCREGMGDRATLARLADTYLAYIYHAQNVDGTFRNFASYDRRFLERVGSEDSYGRALWGVAYCLAHPPRSDQRPLLEEIFIRAVGHLDRARSPRTVAYGVLALSYFLDHHPGDEAMLNYLDRLCNRLVDHYRDSQHEDWRWFEGYLTYSNGILPYALFRALRHIKTDEVRRVAEESTDFLARQTIHDGVLSPIGCEAPFLHRGERPRFDQQPVDVMAKVLLFSEACRHQDMQPHCEHTRIAFDWFLGKNDLNVPLYDPETGGCNDGLMASGANRNQGAESLLAYLISRVEMEAFRRDDHPCSERRVRETDRARARAKFVNGYALPRAKTTPAPETTGA